MLKRQIRRFLHPPRCLDLDSFNPPSLAQLFLSSPTPDLHLDHQPLYFIRQNGAGRGLFSLVSAVVCHLHLADQFNLMPIVDLSDSPTEYHDPPSIEIESRRQFDPWTHFFRPISVIDRQSTRRDRLHFLSSTGFPNGYPAKMLISQHQPLRDIAERQILPSLEMEARLVATQDDILAGYRVLGVHIRGQEQKTMPYHPLSPTLEQIYSAIETAIENHGFDRIFVASEDLDYVEAVLNRFPDRAVTLPHFRTRSPTNAYRINPRPQHKLRLGEEILIDAFMLSQCDGLVSSTSNVTEFARSKNNGRYLIDLVIDNGLNASNPLLAKYLWAVKNWLPDCLGGFSMSAIQQFPDISMPSPCLASEQ